MLRERGHLFPLGGGDFGEGEGVEEGGGGAMGVLGCRTLVRAQVRRRMSHTFLPWLTHTHTHVVPITYIVILVRGMLSVSVVLFYFYFYQVTSHGKYLPTSAIEHRGLNALSLFVVLELCA